jgi:hypothetical protein
LANVLILDGHCSAALAFVRSLGRAGHCVIVGGEQRFFSPASNSKYCRQSYFYPSPVIDVDDFFCSIEDVVVRENIDVIFPMTDITVWPLSCWQGHCLSAKIAVSPCKSVELVSDKYQTIRLAEKLGVPVPRTKIISSENDLDGVLSENWRCPVVIKDRFSMRWENGKGIAGGVDFACSAEELAAKVKLKLEKSADIAIQQFAIGVGIGFSCFAIGDEIFWPFQWERIREKDPRGSGSSARKSVTLDPALVDFSTKLVLASGFQGICMVEYKKNPKTGELFLMEINGRPWGSLQLAVHAGYDYPKALADWVLTGNLPEKRRAYKKNITCRWLVADLIHLENVKHGCPPGWPVPYPSLVKSSMDVLIPWYPGLRYDHLSWDDPLPGLREFYRWLKEHLPLARGRKKSL